jgi:energy-coupling factor transporter ATP-binding protein EcfA2
MTSNIATEIAPPGATSSHRATYFTSLTVRDFRCFKEQQTLILSNRLGSPARWTVVLGENGVGKTTLLQCLALTQPDHIDLPELGPGVRGGVIQRYDLSMLSRWFADRVFPEQFKVEYKISQDALGSSPQHSADAEIVIRREPNDTLVTSSLYSNYGDTTPLLLACYGYGAARRVSRKALSETPSKNTSITLFDSSADLINAEEWLLQIFYATKIKSNDHRLNLRRRLAEGALSSGILPDVQSFIYGITDDSAMTPKVEVETPYGRVRISDLSLGYQTSLTWIVDLISRLFERYPDSPNPLAEPAIVLVDEIDLHLHPRWQRELLRLLSGTFPNAQFIVTAHSPLVVQAAPDANIALLRRNGDHVEIVNDVDHIRRWRVDQILASELFGEQPTHAPEVESILDERARLLGKSRLTRAERGRLDEINRELDRLPTAERPADQEAIDLIRETAALLRANPGA